MGIKLCLFIYYILSRYVSSTSYDQRQTGDFNVQVDFKDVQIIALMKGGKEEYVDYDYAYDYSEMTIKPQNRTTPKPLNVTSSSSDTAGDNVTIATTVYIDQTTAAPPLNNSSNNLNATVTVNNPVNMENIPETTILTENKNFTSTPDTTNNNCKKGFVLNHKGECEFKLQGTGNALLKLVKLSQKLKLRRDNKSNGSDSISL